MRALSVLSLMLGIVVGGAGALPGQAMGGDAAPSSLEDRIALALRSSPDVLLAEAKLRQAQAELDAARLKVTQQVLAGHFERRRQEQVLSHLESKLAATRQRVKVGQAPHEDEQTAEVAYLEARLALERSEMEQRYLLGTGKLPAAAPSSAAPTPVGARAPVERPPVPETLRAALERVEPLEVAAAEATALRGILQLLQASTGLSFVLDRALLEEEDPLLRGLPAHVPVRALLLAIADQADGICFVARDYGFFVTTIERGWFLPGASIPAEVPYKGVTPGGS